MTTLKVTPAKDSVFEDSSPTVRVTLLFLIPSSQISIAPITLPWRSYTHHNIPLLTNCILTPNDLSHFCDKYPEAMRSTGFWGMHSNCQCNITLQWLSCLLPPTQPQEAAAFICTVGVKERWWAKFSPSSCGLWLLRLQLPWMSMFKLLIQQANTDNF